MLSSIALNGINLKVIEFSGGEVQIVIPEGPNINFNKENNITAHLKCNSGFMALAQLKSILDYNVKAPSILTMPYVPYGRYDRRMKELDSQSLKIFSNMLNALNFDVVVISDPHSYVTENSIDNCSVITQVELLGRLSVSTFFNERFTGIVSPDLGATNKAEEVSKLFNLPLIRCLKNRDKDTGKLLSFEVIDNVQLNSNLLIVDDICDGGGTFIGTAKALKEAGASTVSLYTTHGIYSKGVDPLLTELSSVSSYYSWIDDPRINFKIKY